MKEFTCWKSLGLLVNMNNDFLPSFFWNIRFLIYVQNNEYQKAVISSYQSQMFYCCMITARIIFHCNKAKYGSIGRDLSVYRKRNKVLHLKNSIFKIIMTIINHKNHKNSSLCWKKISDISLKTYNVQTLIIKSKINNRISDNLPKEKTLVNIRYKWHN